MGEVPVKHGQFQIVGLPILQVPRVAHNARVQPIDILLQFDVIFLWSTGIGVRIRFFLESCMITSL